MSKQLNLLLHGKSEEAKANRIKSIPKTLYKFYSLTDDVALNESKFWTLERQELWYSSIKDLNDPFEFKSFYVDEDQLAQKDMAEYTVLFNAVKTFSEHLAVVSLTANSFDFMPMWAYYTNNYKGYCVEYDVISPNAFYKVDYEKERIPASRIVEQLCATLNKFLSNGYLPDNTDFIGEAFWQEYFIKHSSWKHEKEFRTIYTLEGEHGVSRPISNILKAKKIVAGFNCSSENISRLQKISDNIGCGGVHVIKPSESKFSFIDTPQQEAQN